MLGIEYPELKDLTYWHDKEIDEEIEFRDQTISEVDMLVSFENFCFVATQIIFGKPPTAIQMEMIRYFEKGPELRGIMAFRNAAKTTISVFYVVWQAYREPRINIFCVSGDQGKARGMVKESRSMYDKINFLAKFHPIHNMGNKGTMSDSADGYNVFGAMGGKSQTFAAAAISGNITGSRAHIIIMDDIETPNNSTTPDLREKLMARDSEADNLLHDEFSGSFGLTFRPFKMYLGTPHTEDSIYYRRQADGYKFRIYPARFPNEDFMRTIGHLVDPWVLKQLEEDPSLGTGYGPNFDEGRVIDLVRFSEDYFLRKRLGPGGASRFAKQQMLDISLSNIEKFPLKLRDLIVADLDNSRARGMYLSEREDIYMIKDLQPVGMPNDRYYGPSYTSKEVFEYEDIKMVIDPSADGADETAYAVVAILNGNYFLLASGGVGAYGGGFGKEAYTFLVSIAKKYKVKKIHIEGNYGGGVFTDAIVPYLLKDYPCEVETYFVKGRKEDRILDTLEPIIGLRRLIISRQVVEQDLVSAPEKAPEDKKMSYSLFYQMARMAREKDCLLHDDRLEAVQACIAQFEEVVYVDQQKATEAKSFEEERAFMEAPLHKRLGLLTRGTAPPRSFFRKHY